MYCISKAIIQTDLPVEFGRKGIMFLLSYSGNKALIIGLTHNSLSNYVFHCICIYLAKCTRLHSCPLSQTKAQFRQW